MRRAKKLIGILLILVSIGGLIYWEGFGRNEFMTEKVLAANETIPKGTVVRRQLFDTVGVLPENLVEGVMRPKDLKAIAGKETVQMIVKNQQLSQSFLREPGKKITEEYAPYVIKGHWIDSRSSSLRKGDLIQIYSRDGSLLLGDFEVVFVKDIDEKEVTDLPVEEVSAQVFSGIRDGEIPDRTNGTGVIDHLEILTSLPEYQKILQFVESTEQTLLIVQKGDVG